MTSNWLNRIGRRTREDNKGFTLIEILVAMVILSAAIGVCSRQYWNYARAVARAEGELTVGRALLGLPELCKRKLEKGVTSGAGVLARKRGRYQWRAHKKMELRNFTQDRGENGALLMGRFLLALYDVELEITAGAGAAPRKYSYKELVWTEVKKQDRVEGVGVNERE